MIVLTFNTLFPSKEGKTACTFRHIDHGADDSHRHPLCGGSVLSEILLSPYFTVLQR